MINRNHSIEPVEEINELIQRPPRWITQWGMTAVTMVFLGLGMGTYFYSYPDIIKGEFILELMPRDSPSDSCLEDMSVRNSNPPEITNQWGELRCFDIQLVLLARVPVLNFEKIERGLKAILKFENYPYSKFGALNGTVVGIVERGGVHTVSCKSVLKMVSLHLVKFR
jgi:hypothetical protein